MRVFDIIKPMALFVYRKKMSIEYITKCMPVNGSGYDKKNTLFKPSLYLS